LVVRDAEGRTEELPYDALIVGTGAVSARPPIEGLSGPDALGPADGVHLLHGMGDTFGIMQSLAARRPKSAIVIVAGYIGLETAEALTTHGLTVTQIEALPRVLPTVDAELGALFHAELTSHGVEVITGTQVSAITRAPSGDVRLLAAGARRISSAARRRPRLGWAWRRSEGRSGRWPRAAARLGSFREASVTRPPLPSKT
jgi:NADPH-dependent 2,4-dienoyl-CoA reductase/sulfur reductase-like enzyme